ncbi:hypothetical protein ACTMTF_32205 [Nonomuraea sp. ZG12]|uniref:hypothetical protein n=1 Tax=Nonomuraea sp. ZG12 TaxID=3452207 RepID=UPI003F8BC860
MMTMDWLLTVPADTDLGTLAAKLSAVGCTLRDLDPVPLGPDEKVVYARGPHDVSARLAAIDIPVKANPDSEPEPYREPGL